MNKVAADVEPPSQAAAAPSSVPPTTPAPTTTVAPTKAAAPPAPVPLTERCPPIYFNLCCAHGHLLNPTRVLALTEIRAPRISDAIKKVRSHSRIPARLFISIFCFRQDLFVFSFASSLYLVNLRVF